MQVNKIKYDGPSLFGFLYYLLFNAKYCMETMAFYVILHLLLRWMSCPDRPQHPRGAREQTPGANPEGVLPDPEEVQY